MARTHIRTLMVGALLSGMLIVGSAVPVDAVTETKPSSNASHSLRPGAITRAALQILTNGGSGRRVVRFALSGSRLGAHQRLRRAVLSFGDGRRVALHRLTARVSHRYRRTGTYRATLVLLDSRGHRATSRRLVIVSGRNVLAFKSTASRESAADITSLTPIDSAHDSFVLRPGSPSPVRGHALVFGPSNIIPTGLVAVVDGVSRNADGSIAVTSHDGTLADIYQHLSSVTSTRIGRQVRLVRSQGDGRVAAGPMARASALPFECSKVGDKGDKILVNGDLSNTHISSVIDLRAKVFSLSVIAKPVFSVGSAVSGGFECTLKSGFSINVPVTAVPGLIVSVAPYVNFSGTGQVNADASWTPTFILNVSRTPKYGDNFLFFKSAATATMSGSASLTLEGGVDVKVSFAKAVGLDASLGPRFVATASVGGGNACVDASSAIEAQVSLFANVFFAKANLTLYRGEYYKSSLLHRCINGGSGVGASGGTVSVGGGLQTHPTTSSGGAGAGAYSGPSQLETTGSVTHTFTDYVHAGGEGPSIASNAPVAIACRIIGFKVADGNTWWYRIASSPWNAAYYASADAFYNNGASSGPLKGTPWVDESVPMCVGSAGSTPAPGNSVVAPTPVGSDNTLTETAGSVAHTWTSYSNAGGTQGPSLASGQGVQIRCKIAGFKVADGNTWWYQIAQAPWSDSYFVSADAFYNNGATSGALKGTPFVDPAVPDCASGSAPAPPAPAPTYSETVGTVANTWSNYSNAGGTHGPSIAQGQTVQIRCKLSGFRVADGNTWWYRIAESPWSDAFYVSADAFYNNGSTSGPLKGTPFVDAGVADC